MADTIFRDRLTKFPACRRLTFFFPWAVSARRRLVDLFREDETSRGGELFPNPNVSA
jgi:hypothetical protein